MTDYYSQCEGALMDKLRTLTDLFPNDWQVSDDDSVINRGADYFAIFQPDAFPATRAASREVDFNWIVIFDLCVRYKTRKESLPKFKAARAAIIQLIAPHALNGTNNISRTVLSSNGSILEGQKNNANFLFQTLSATITQRVRF